MKQRRVDEMSARYYFPPDGKIYGFGFFIGRKSQKNKLHYMSLDSNMV